MSDDERWHGQGEAVELVTDEELAKVAVCALGRRGPLGRRDRAWFRQLIWSGTSSEHYDHLKPPRAVR